jgi:phosphoesterase RecJ-like protein
VKDIVAVAFFKENGPGDWRLSMRSKGNINVNAIAREFGGGGHANASGCSVGGDFAELKVLFEEKLAKAIELAK